MKICFVAEDFYPNFIGGQGVYGYHLVSELAKMGNKVTVLAEKRTGREKFWLGMKNIRLIEVPFCFGNKLILAVLEYFYFLRFCHKESFDVVHLNGVSGFLFTLFKPKNVEKVIVMDHNTNYEMNQETHSKFKKMIYPALIFLERILFEKADGILFNNPQEEKSVKNYYKIDQIPTKSVYLGVDRAKFSLKERKDTQIKLRHELKIPLDAKIVLYVGRLVERKRVDTIIRAIKEIATSSLDKLGTPRNDGSAGVYGVIVGDGPELNNLKFEIRNLKLENIRLVGWTYEPREYYLASDCFVTVSVAEGGFLITAQEAASYGLPLILSSSAAGFPIINQGINGFIVESNNPLELADKIKKVIKDEKVIEDMGQESRRSARQFSWEKCARETVKFYLHVINITG